MTRTIRLFWSTSVKKAVLSDMETYIKLMLLLLTVLSCVRCAEITVTGDEGGTAAITCPSQEGYESYPKYLRKGVYEDGVDVIRSDGRAEWTHKGRVSLLDKKGRNNFTVLLHNLTPGDSGRYGCGVNTWGSDYFTIVHLKVVPKKQTIVHPKVTAGVITVLPTSPSESATYNATSSSVAVTTGPENSTQFQTDHSSASSDQLKFMSGGLATALVVFGLLIMTFRLMKSRHRRNGHVHSEDTREDGHLYSEIEPPSPDLQSDPQCSSALTAIYSLASPAAPEDSPTGLQTANHILQPTPASDDIYSYSVDI
ncbi:hypothetical protein ACEWY4_017311 [Coilia grayii]|uniref:Uncharacterized protein n=1 Tax=Coilia grayii TaxID=363190 RepID=A0ABD1JGH3_9TELE